ncbi:MAG TPA: site-specific integrase, partial [Caulobacteraceae bacterium]
MRLSTLTGHEALRAFLEHLEHERRAGGRTLEAYGACVRAYLAFLEGHLGDAPSLVALGEVTAADLRAYLAARRTGVRPLSARSLSQALSAIRAFHRFLDARLA